MANSYEKTLAALGVTQPDQVAALFARLSAEAGADLAAVDSAGAFEKFRVHWLGRKAGVITLVGDNWLKPANPELKRAVGQELNRFKSELEALVEARRATVESRKPNRTLWPRSTPTIFGDRQKSKNSSRP